MPGWVQDYFHAENQTASQQFGLPTSRLLYRPNPTLPNVIQARVSIDLAPELERSPLVDEIQAESGLAVIDLPMRTPIEIYQPSLEGPSLSMRGALVQLALATADDPKTPIFYWEAAYRKAGWVIHKLPEPRLHT